MHKSALSWMGSLTQMMNVLLRYWRDSTHLKGLGGGRSRPAITKYVLYVRYRIMKVPEISICHDLSIYLPPYKKKIAHLVRTNQKTWISVCANHGSILGRRSWNGAAQIPTFRSSSTLIGSPRWRLWQAPRAYARRLSHLFWAPHLSHLLNFPSATPKRR